MVGKQIFKSSKAELGRALRPYQRPRSRAKAKQPATVDLIKTLPKENLSFCGCGFLGIYHLGVASCFHEYAPHLSRHKVSGSSAGAIVAVAHICGDPHLASCTSGFLRIAEDARARSLGPFHPSFDINARLRDELEAGLPEDVHFRVNGKLHISLTRDHDKENVIISKFDSREDLIQALLCSCFIPVWSGYAKPKYKGVTYVDGGLSNNLLVLDDNTVTVSPFSGEADICPRDGVSSLYTVNFSNTSFSVTPHNLNRIRYALMPPSPEDLSELYALGFANGIEYLQRMRLISCTNCQIQSSLVVTHETEIISYTHRKESSSSIDESVSIDTITLCEENDIIVEEEIHCDGCILRSKNAPNDPLPKQFSDRFREACDSVNKNIFNWFYSHRPIKILSYLAAPYYLPLNISMALFLKYWQHLPELAAEVVKCACELKEFIGEVLKKLQGRSTTSILMSPSSVWRDESDELITTRQQQKNAESSISVKITADCRRSTIRSLTSFDFCLTVVLFGRDMTTNTTSKCI